MITIAQALRTIRNAIKAAPATVVPVADALGLVLAENVRARADIPPFANSAMDGYAVRSADTRGAGAGRPAALRLLEVLPAGRVPSRRLRTGWATKIMTGAPLPRGADAIVMVEDTAEEKGRVLCRREVAKGENVRRAGEDVRRGETVLRKGKELRPQEMGMLAALGRTSVRAVRRPRVAVLSTGSELVPPDRVPGPGRVRNCNTSSLIGLVTKYGATPVDFGLAGDDPRRLRAKLVAASSCDLILTSGGVSVGDYDLVKEVLGRCGARMKFWQVRVKPGKPLAFGLIGGKPVFGLPGNPVSVIISFELFVRPALLRMMGRRDAPKRTLMAVLEETIEKAPGRVHLIRARVRRRKGVIRARPTGPQGSGILKSLVMADGLILVPAAARRIRAGEKVRVMMLD